MSKHEIAACYDGDEFPDDWHEGDFEALDSVLRDQDMRLVSPAAESDYDWLVLREVDDE